MDTELIRGRLLDGRFLDEHHRDLVADGIDQGTVRIDALKARLGLIDLDL